MFILAPLFSLAYFVNVGILLLVTFLILFTIRKGQINRRDVGYPDFSSLVFDWLNLPAYKYLEYTPCYNGLLCARLELPMDWNDTEADSTMQMAVIRLPAIVPVDHEKYGGAIILNPGGPGESGVKFVRNLGLHLQQIVSPWSTLSNGEDGKSFDIISFDPRGVGLSTPYLPCDGCASLELGSAKTTCDGSDWVNAGHILNERCNVSHAQGTIIEHMTTSVVARDMLELVERHGEWREMTKYPNDRAAAERSYDRGSEKLQFWGFSYGSVLGATFATLFPDRISRMVLDGVEDVGNYQSSFRTGRQPVLKAAMQSFYDRCAGAGSKYCPVDAVNLTSPEIEAKLLGQLDILSKKSCLEAQNWKISLSAFLKNPLGLHINFVELAKKISQFPIEVSNLPPTDGLCAALHLYVCNDGNLIRNNTEKEAAEYFQKTTDMNPIWGFMDARLRSSCVNYPFKAKPWFETASNDARGTSAPILWVGNTLDPITPLSNAQKGQEHFSGSGLLVIEGIGHTSSALYSDCAEAEIRRYFHDGTIIAPEVHCPSRLPFCEVIGDC